MLIKSQSEVRLHTGRSVHFHPGRCARPSFSIFRGSGSETTYVMGHQATMLVIIVQVGVLVCEQGFYGVVVLFFSAAGQSGGGLSHSPAHLHHELSLLG